MAEALDTTLGQNGNSILYENAQSLLRETEWFTRIVNIRLGDYFDQSTVSEIPGSETAGNHNDHAAGRNTLNDLLNTPPSLENDHSVYADFVRYYELTVYERLLLMLALIFWAMDRSELSTNNMLSAHFRVVAFFFFIG